MPRPVTITNRVFPTSSEVAFAAAELFASTVAAAVEERGLARVAISGGSTPKVVFALLADPAQPFLASIPWAKLQLFWVDERCVAPTEPDSNYRMTNEQMLSKVPLPAENIHRMEGELDPEVAAARYESDIRNTFKLEGAETPTFDLILLGMGDDGHTASLFPHTEGLDAIAPIVIANHVPQKDTWRISLTWPVINQGREVAFLIEGAAKADVLHAVFTGPYQPETYPSQLIRPASGRLTLLLDAGAASKLPAGDTIRLS
ncbi:6-phosphogluconolactonase [Granulicella rosea]|uniref:6-phosphogluconolactonase n=1 Tax=Granulicella rosea TaxID=474952 RepID=A0A239KRQ7_9BACT|nr:6-phosphogluconolactonase [Granulicella rosea]SNT20720.1 6-phosphogluconolactonase [Granulicella rosea]